MQKEPAKSEKKVTRNFNDSNIVDIILNDHEPLKKLIKIMKDSDKDLKERTAAFEKFAPILMAHAKPEEQVLYTYMKSKKELREEGFEGDVEHMLADQMVEECKRTKDRDLLGAQIKILAELVEHHIEEEERELLPDFNKNSDSDEREQLAEKFLKLKEDYVAADDKITTPDPKAKKEKSLHH